MAEVDRTETDLRVILDRVDGWLRFAEVKNGGVIALSATVSTALLAALRNVGDLSLLDRGLFTAAVVLFLLSMAVALYSYLPRTQPERVKPTAPRPGGGDNLFFYGDLACYAPDDLVQAIAQRYGGRPSTGAAVPAVQHDLAAQVTVNSRITVRKLRLFERGGLLALAGSLFYAAALIARLLGY